MAKLIRTTKSAVEYDIRFSHEEFIYLVLLLRNFDSSEEGKSLGIKVFQTESYKLWYQLEDILLNERFEKEEGE